MNTARATSRHMLLGLIAMVVMAAVMLGPQRPAQAYIGGPPLSLGRMCDWSTHVMIARIEKLNRDKGIILYRKIRDLKGRWPTETYRHAFAVNFPERDYIFDWAAEGKIVVCCALESYKWSHTYIDGDWYTANTGDWQAWNVSHSEPLLLRMYSGKSDRLADAATAILNGKEVVVPGLMDGTPQELQKRRTKVLRLRASLKILDYNFKRDFVDWGSDEFRPLGGMPGFEQFAAVCRVDPGAAGVSVQDIDGHGQSSFCFFGQSKVALLQVAGNSLREVALPYGGGARSVTWADYNGDGKPDLLLATAAGPRLLANQGKGQFADETARLPREAYYNVSAAEWLDFDGDKQPDLLLANGFLGLRLYRHLGAEAAAKAASNPVPPTPEKPGQPPTPANALTAKGSPTNVVPPLFEDVSDRVGLGPSGVAGRLKGDHVVVADVNGDGRPDFLYCAGRGVLAINTGRGFAEAQDSGIDFQPGGGRPVFLDINGDGKPDLFVPQENGSKLFLNDGRGHFTDVTARSGDLAKPLGRVTSAAACDFRGTGKPDLFLGCFKGGNRYLKNNGDGTFTDASDRFGFHQRVFNSRGLALADVNRDGVPDLLLANEGQESVVLLGAPKKVAGEALSSR